MNEAINPNEQDLGMYNPNMVFIHRVNKDVYCVVAVSDDTAKPFFTTEETAYSLKEYLERGNNETPFQLTVKSVPVLTIQPQQGRLIFEFSDKSTVFRRNYHVKPFGKYMYTEE